MSKRVWLGAAVVACLSGTLGPAVANGWGGARPMIQGGGSAGHAAPGAGRVSIGAARPLPAVSGIIHERPGRRPYATTFGGRPLRPFADAGQGPYDEGRRFADRGHRWRRGDGTARYGAYPDAGTPDGPGSGDASGFGEAGAAYPYAEPSVASTYGEPPLGPSPYGGSGAYGDDHTNTADYPGTAPRIIVVSAAGGTAGSCPCRTARSRPVVYRYGIGSRN